MDDSKKTKELLISLEKRLENGEVSHDEYKRLKQKYKARMKKINKKAGLSPSFMVSISGSGKVSQDLISISGSGSVNGFGGGPIRISGSGKITEDKISVSGSAKLSGDLKTKIFKASGSLMVDGNVWAEEIKCSGSSKIDGNLTIDDEARFSGSTIIDGDVKVKNGDFESSGSTKVEGGVEAIDISLSGSFKINEDVSSETFYADIGDRCKIGGLLSAVDVTIEKDRRRGRLSVNEIRATGKVYLEGVTADLVTGKKIDVGPDCDIGEVREEP